MVHAKKKKSTDSQTRFWEKISLIAEISARCRAATESREAYIEVLELISKIIPFDAATLYLLDDDEKRLAEAATIGSRVEILDIVRTDKGDGISGLVATNQKPILLSDRRKKSGFDPEIDFATVLSVPLLIEDDVIGVMNLGCYAPGALEEKHVKLLAITADQFAVSIERLSFEEEIKRKNADLEVAHRELEEAQQNLIRIKKLEAVTELSASINHEINNPLSVIIGNVQCLKMQMEIPDQKSQSRLNRIEEAAMRISDINRKLLQIDTLVLENYLDGTGNRMLNLDKSVTK